MLRTSWVYSMRQGGFVTKVLQWARQQEVMRVVDDQVSGPTSARMLAEISALIWQGLVRMLMAGSASVPGSIIVPVTAPAAAMNGQKDTRT